MATIDAHDHSPGKGVPITPAGLNISSDLGFLINNAVQLRSARFVPSTVSGPADVNAIYINSAGDLYYINSTGTQVRITNGGSIVGTAGSITGLPSGTASATYLAGPGTFQFQSATNTPANIDGASFILRDQTAGSHGVTLAAPSGLTADYTITFPAYPLPSVTNIMTLDSSGNIAATLNVDNSTLQIAANTISVKNGGITNDKLGPINSQISSSCGYFATSSATPVAVTNLSVTITTVGRPVWVGLIPDGTTGQSVFNISDNTFIPFMYAEAQILNGATVIASPLVICGITGLGTRPQMSGSGVPVGSVFTIDTPAAGTITYSIKLFTFFTSSVAAIQNAKLFAYEL
jgi:hypothetical protein